MMTFGVALTNMNPGSTEISLVFFILVLGFRTRMAALASQLSMSRDLSPSQS